MAVLAVGGYAGWKHFGGRKSALDQYQITTVQRADIEDLVTATGNLQPREYVDVGAQVSGQLKKIHVEIGSVVRAGDLLAEIDPTVYRANVEARRAQLRNLQATMGERQSQLALAQLQRDRQRNLMAGEATTSEAVQQAEAALKGARAQVDALQAQIEQSQSTLQADEANLNYANIYSPISGVVVSITARQGQTINANQQAPILLRVADLSTMTVQTQVSEADIAQLRPDMDAYFTTLGNRGRRWSGKLRKVEPTPTVTNNVVLYNALFDVENDQRNLLPQMTAQVFFVSATAQDALLVPASAVSIQRQSRERAGAGRGASSAVEPAVSASRAAMVSSGPGGNKRSSAGKVADKADGSASRADVARGRRARETGLDSASEAATAGARIQVANAGRRDAASPAGGAPDLSAMSPAERRAVLGRMSPEERDAFRARRRAMRVQQGSDGVKPIDNSGKPSARASTPMVWAGVAPGRQQRPRDGVVKVVTADGQIEERKVKVGISNRVQVQILEGLREGEKVVAGIKPPPSARGDSNGRTAFQGGQGGMQQGGPGGVGGGGFGGGAGGAGGVGGGRSR
jgi:macrolide-specific efflux system membrane fusion protein